MIVRVDAIGADDEVLRELAAPMSATELQFSSADGRDRGRGEPRLAAHGCDLLTDDADWDAATWAMSPHAVDELLAAVTTLFNALPNEVVFSAMWSDDEVGTELDVSRDDITNVIRQSALGTRTRYRVRARDVG